MPNMPTCNILLSSAGRRVALLRILKHTLRDLNLAGRIFAADMSPRASAFQLSDVGLIVPRCTSPSFIPHMLDVCAKHEIRLIIPTIDTELPIYAAHRADFAKIGTTVLVSAPEVIAIAGDKVHTHLWLVEYGLPTVSQRSATEVLDDPSDWAFPCIVKPRAGSSSVGVSRVPSLDVLRAEAGPNDVVQAIAPGREFTVDFLADESGLCLCTVPRMRLETRGGEVSKGLTVRHPELQNLARRVCEALPGAFGTLCVQIFLDQDSGQMNIIEINPRFGGGFPLSWEAGANFPKWIIERLFGLPRSVQSDAWKDRLLMLRYDDAVFVEADKLAIR